MNTDFDMMAQFIDWLETYLSETKDYGYYNLKSYIIKNKTEFEPLFRSRASAMIISEYLKSAKRDAGVRYKESFPEAYRNYIKTEVEK